MYAAKMCISHAGFDADDPRVVPKDPGAGGKYHRKGRGAHVAQSWAAAGERESE